MNPSPKPVSSDATARRRIRESLDESLIVEASAGTGKTTELVNRIVEALASRRARIDRIAAVTFTHKAAGEMKLRLREELDKKRPEASGERRVALEDALERLEEASIGTIHNFCAQILRERPVEANVDPAFEELGDQEANRLYMKAFRAWLERQLNADSPGLRRAFARLAWRDAWDDSPAIEPLQRAGWKLIEWRDYPAAWQREPFAREEEIRTMVEMVRDLAVLSAQPRRVNDKLYIGLRPARGLAGWIERAGGSRDYDTLESLILKLARDLRRDARNGSGEYGGGVPREDLVSKRDELLRWIGEFKTRADSELAALLREDMRGLLDEYEKRKRRQGKLDFVDLLVRTRDLLVNQPEARKYLQDRFSHIFIDEFQDTDPLQAEILLLLSSGDPSESDWRKVRPKPGKLFLVGDPKQSIYKFRRADLLLYREVRDALIERGVGFVSLTQSYRSVPNIQELVNAAFESEMNGDAAEGHAEWHPLEKFREEIEGRPSAVVLPVPRPYKTHLSKEAIAGSLPDAIAAFIAWLIKESGWGFCASDIAVLFRKRNYSKIDLTRELIRALEARDIAHLVAGSKSFHHREEVETLRVALTAIEWPGDELSVFAALKGSLFAISDELLFLFRHRHGRLYPFHETPAEEPEFAPIVEALAILADLHRARNRRPFAATVNALLEATRAHAGFLLRPGGQQILANVSRVAELARSFETSGGISFRGFVEELTAQAEKEEASEAPVLEQDSDGVRIMTVHSAKGLDFRAVILADPMTGLSRREPEAHIDSGRKLCAVELAGCAPLDLRRNAAQEAARERAEGIRVAYVAATRAKDLLVIPAVGDRPYPPDSWLSPLYKAIYPAFANWRKSKPASGCPNFGPASVVARSQDYGPEEESSVRPGLIQPEAGSHEVVWWDPSKLKLGEEISQTLWHDEVLTRALQPDDGSSLAAYKAWREGREKLLESAAQPQFNVFLASQAADAPPGSPIPVEYISARTAARSASGSRFGTLVHATLRDAPLDADASAISKFAALNGRILGARPAEIETASAAVDAALRHPLLARARAAERCHREYPLVLRMQDGLVLEGVLDLAFLENGEWIVVDFKTDADSPDLRKRYQRQLQWYAFALAQLTATPAKAVLLGV